MELFTEALLPWTAPISILLALLMLYWVTVILGFLDLEATDIDIDIDLDVDIDLDIDAEIDTDVEVGLGHGFGIDILLFMNLGTVPLTIVLTAFVFTMWLVSIWSNFYLNPTSSNLISLGLLTGNIVASLVIAKIITAPFKAIFSRLKAVGHVKVIGRSCNVILQANHAKLGQATIQTDEGPLTFNIKTTDENMEVMSGMKALIVAKDDESGFYRVTPLIDEPDLNLLDT